MSLDYKQTAVQSITNLTDQTFKNMSTNEVSLKYSNESTANNLRKQQSHHHQHITNKQELTNRSVNFGNNRSENQHVYSQIKVDKIDSKLTYVFKLKLAKFIHRPFF